MREKLGRCSGLRNVAQKEQICASSMISLSSDADGAATRRVDVSVSSSEKLLDELLDMGRAVLGREAPFYDEIVF